MDEKVKYHLEDIFQKFIEPHFSISKYIVYFEWDNISRNYRYVVTPKGSRNKFISFYLHRHEKVDDFEMVVVYTSVGEFNAPNNQKLMFLMAHDELERFNRFYQDFIDDLDERSLEKSPVDIFIPISFSRE